MSITSAAGPLPLHLALGDRRTLAAAVVLRMGHQAGEAMVPVMIGVVIDSAVAAGSVSALVLSLLGLAAVFLVLSLCFRFGARATARAMQFAGHRLRVRIAARILAPRAGAEGARLPGELFSIATADATRVSMLNNLLVGAAASLAALGVAVVVLLRTSLLLGALVVLGTPVLLWLVHRASRPLEERSGAEQERAGQVGGLAADLVTGFRALRGIRAEGAAHARYVTASRSSLRATLRAARAEAALGGVTLALTGVFLAVVALVGGQLAMSGQISVGGLVATVGLAQFIAGPMGQLALVGTRLAQVRASATRVWSVLDAPPGLRDGGRQPVQPVAGAFALRGLRAGGIGGGSGTGGSGLDLDLPAGALVGIAVEDSGQAAVLADLLGRAADPDGGSVDLDGVALTDLDVEAARGAVLLVGHDSMLFGPTLGDALSEVAVPGADLCAVLAAAAADEVLEAVPAGRATELGERGHRLSGGQRQRVVLARALAAEPPVLVAHDPTTALDPVTESRIAAGLRELRAGRTTVLVTTSAILLSACDEVTHLADGRVQARGSHAELLDTAGYRELVTR